MGLFVLIFGGGGYLAGEHKADPTTLISLISAFLGLVAGFASLKRVYYVGPKFRVFRSLPDEIRSQSI